MVVVRDWDKFDRRGFDSRIRAILGEDDDRLVSEKSILKYKKYLIDHLTFPCRLTGIEDFYWEEFYVIGPGSREEYEELKKTHPSYTDEFELIGFYEGFDEREGVLVNVKRSSDDKQFTLPLGELMVIDKYAENHQLVDDYAVWIVNY